MDPWVPPWAPLVFTFPPPGVFTALAPRPPPDAPPDTPDAVALGPVEDRVRCEEVLTVKEGRPRVPVLGLGLV